MKILYAANNNYSSRFQLFRFLENFSNNHTLKISAYQKSCPPNVNIDFTLDPLLHYEDFDTITIKDNENFWIYFNLIKNFSPDIIISDLEVYTNFVAQKLNIPYINN